jgi:hypothetical protein
MSNPNFDYPPPDPAWDYYQIWYEIQHLKAQTDSTIRYMMNIEEATDKSNHQLAEQLERIKDHLKAAAEMLNIKQ